LEKGNDKAERNKICMVGGEIFPRECDSIRVHSNENNGTINTELRK
jgi:hypothetical protein